MKRQHRKKTEQNRKQERKNRNVPTGKQTKKVLKTCFLRFFNLKPFKQESEESWRSFFAKSIEVNVYFGEII